MKGASGNARIELRGTAQLDLGRGELVLLLQRQPEVVERFGVGRVELDERPVHRHGLRKVALLHQGGPQVQPRGKVGRLRRDELLKDRHGFVAATRCDSARPRLFWTSGADGSRRTAASRWAIAPSRSPNACERDAETSLYDGQPRVQADRFSQLLDRGLQPSVAVEASGRDSSGLRHDRAAA